MPWFRHHYYCAACDGAWLAEAEIVVEGDCRFCGARDVFPYKSDDRTRVIEAERGQFIVFEAMKKPPGDYRRLKSFATRAAAEDFLGGH